MISKKNITIADVAQKAGVSKQTVSRVINEKPDVAPHTRSHIKAIIKSLGYTPDPIARSMKGQTHTIGCITPNLTDVNFSSIVQAAQNEAYKHGYFVLIGSAQSEYDVPPLLNEMISRRVDGLLVINPRDDQRYRHFLPLIEADTPIVYIKNSPVDEPVSAICLDDEMGGFIATEYLLSLGHRKIVTILGPENEECTQDRLAGYLRGLHTAGIQVDHRLIVHGDWSAKSGKIALGKLYDYAAHFTAIFAQNDHMALGAMQAIKQAGLRIPHEISIIGYDDLPLSSFFDPPLTTIHQPMALFGEVAVQHLIDAINKSDNQPEVIRLEPTLIARESCASI